jgi:hypothetical protein
MLRQRQRCGLWPRARRAFAGITRESPAKHLKFIDIGGFKTLFLFPFQALDTQTWGASKRTEQNLSSAKTPHLPVTVWSVHCGISGHFTLLGTIQCFLVPNIDRKPIKTVVTKTRKATDLETKVKRKQQETG